MNEYQPIRGTKPLADRKVDRQLSVNYLHQKKNAADLLAELWRKAPGGVDEHGNEVKPANCYGKEEFTSDDLMTDREAALACAGCPLFSICRTYSETAHPAWGTFGGRVHGRALQEAMGDE